MKIAVDMDDVIVDFWRGVYASIFREFGVSLPPSVEWDDNPVKDFDGFGKGGFWGWLREREWLWATFDAVPGAMGGIRQLRQAGHFVEIVTSKPEWAEHNVWKWLGKWRPAVHRVTIVAPNGVSKADATDADVLVDDKPENCEGFARTGRWGLLFHQSHNGRYEPIYRVCRVQGWEDVLAWIGGYPDAR